MRQAHYIHFTYIVTEVKPCGKGHRIHGDELLNDLSRIIFVI